MSAPEGTIEGREHRGNATAPTPVSNERDIEDERENTATPAMAVSPVTSLSGTSDTTGEFERGLILRERYVLEQVIGRGGTSVVFRARDLHRACSEGGSSDFIAVKLLRTEWRADPQAIERLRREFRQMQSLSHAGIARVFDLDCDDDVWFMTMELIEGRTLKAWMQESYERHDALRVIEACGQALAHAHALGYLHGDLKPSNVMLADDGAVKLIDFGSAPTPGSRLAQASDAALAATRLYASPQILAGKAGEARDDVFSLACLSYGLLSYGRHPFGRRPSFEDGRAKSAPTHVSAIPAGLFSIIEGALAADRNDRPESVAVFLSELAGASARLQSEALSVAASDTPVAVERMRPALPMTPLSERHSAWALAGLAGMTIAVAAVAVLLDPIPRPAAGAGASALSVQSKPALAALPVMAADAAAAPMQSSTDSESSTPGNQGLISFETSDIHATTMQPLVAVSVRRVHGVRSAGAFIWRVEGGTAYPGVDYQRLRPQLVRFQEGQTVRTLFIPLMNSRAAGYSTPRARTFTVELEPVSGGPALGRIDRVTITIEPAGTLARASLYQARAEQ